MKQDIKTAVVIPVEVKAGDKFCPSDIKGELLDKFNPMEIWADKYGGIFIVAKKEGNDVFGSYMQPEQITVMDKSCLAKFFMPIKISNPCEVATPELATIKA